MWKIKWVPYTGGDVTSEMSKDSFIVSHEGSRPKMFLNSSIPSPRQIHDVPG